MYAVLFIFLASSFVWDYNPGKDCDVGLDDLNEWIIQWLEAGNRYFGSRIHTEAAEPFSTAEPLGLTGLECLT